MCVSDDALFRVLEIQMSLANVAKKRGKYRPASACLERAFQEGAASAKAGKPAGRVACAICRLQSCTNLSSCGKHSEALEEACAAVLEIDRMWKDITKANGEAQAAMRDNRDVNEVLKRMPPGIRSMMQKPPKWLEKAVVISIEAKQCVALELEYCLRQSDPSLCAATELGTTQVSGNDQFESQTELNRPKSAPVVGSKALQSSIAQQSIAGVAGVQQLKDPWGLISQLHLEALTLAEMLLPPRHQVVERSRRVLAQAQHRNTNGRAMNLHQHAPYDLCVDATGFVQHEGATEIEVEAAGPVVIDAIGESDCTQAHTPPGIADINAMLTDNGVESSTSLDERTWLCNVATQIRRPESAQPRARFAQRTVSSGVDSGNRPHSSQGRTPQKIHGHDIRERNIFKQWQEDQCEWNQLSMLKKKMSSEAGLEDLRTNFRQESQRFLHTTLNDKHPDDLFELRTQFNGPMVAERKRQQERRQQGVKKKPVASTLELQEALAKQWATLYGVRKTGKKTTGSILSKLSTFRREEAERP
jgi:hypothetical protein